MHGLLIMVALSTYVLFVYYLSIIDGGIVFTWNNMSYKVIDITTVRIKMDDNILKTRTNVKTLTRLKEKCHFFRNFWFQFQGC